MSSHPTAPFAHGQCDEQSCSGSASSACGAYRKEWDEDRGEWRRAAGFINPGQPTLSWLARDEARLLPLRRQSLTALNSPAPYVFSGIAKPRRLRTASLS
jgi:hypothetical protein